MSKLKRSAVLVPACVFALGMLDAPAPTFADDDLVTTSSAGLGPDLVIDPRPAGLGRAMDPGWHGTRDVFDRKGLGIDAAKADPLRAPTMDATRGPALEVMHGAQKAPSALEVLAAARTNLLGPSMDWMRRRTRTALAGTGPRAKKGKAGKAAPKASGPYPDLDLSAVADLGLEPLAPDTADAATFASTGVRWARILGNANPDRASTVMLALTTRSDGVVALMAALEEQGGRVEGDGSLLVVGALGPARAVVTVSRAADGTQVVLWTAPLGGSYLLTMMATGEAATARNAARLTRAVRLPAWAGARDDATITTALLQAAPVVPVGELDLTAVDDLGLQELLLATGLRAYATLPGAAPGLFVVATYSADGSDRSFERARQLSTSAVPVAPVAFAGLDGVQSSTQTVGADGVTFHVALQARPPDGGAYLLAIDSSAAVPAEVVNRLAAAFVVRQEHALVPAPSPGRAPVAATEDATESDEAGEAK